MKRKKKKPKPNHKPNKQQDTTEEFRERNMIVLSIELQVGYLPGQKYAYNTDPKVLESKGKNPLINMYASSRYKYPHI